MINVESSNLVFLKTYNTEVNAIIKTFMDQNGRQLEKREKVNFTFLINKWKFYNIKKIKYDTKRYRFLSFARKWKKIINGY